jgi:hypothetical protein
MSKGVQMRGLQTTRTLTYARIADLVYGLR